MIKFYYYIIMSWIHNNYWLCSNKWVLMVEVNILCILIIVIMIKFTHGTLMLWYYIEYRYRYRC